MIVNHDCYIFSNVICITCIGLAVKCLYLVVTPPFWGGGGRVSRNRSLSPPLFYTGNNNIYLIEISPIYPTCYTQLLGFFVLRKEHLDQVGVVPETRKAEVITHRPLPLLLLSFHPVLIISTKGFSPFANITNS